MRRRAKTDQAEQGTSQSRVRDLDAALPILLRGRQGEHQQNEKGADGARRHLGLAGELVSNLGSPENMQFLPDARRALSKSASASSCAHPLRGPIHLASLYTTNHNSSAHSRHKKERKKTRKLCEVIRAKSRSPP